MADAARPDRGRDRYGLERQGCIATRGWTGIRPTAREVLADPGAVADGVRHALAFHRLGR